jgi:hypothetical protein
MRSDMPQVIIERPRGGPRFKTPKGERRRDQRIPDDERPTRESIGRKWSGSPKWLNEHLGPLRRFLRSNVGRPWNKVYSEICARIRRDSAVQDHVRDHVFDYVTVNVILVDGVPCSREGSDYGMPIGRYDRRELYVCPRTGILRRIRNRPAKRIRAGNRLCEG